MVKLIIDFEIISSHKMLMIEDDSNSLINKLNKIYKNQLNHPLDIKCQMELLKLTILLKENSNIKVSIIVILSNK